MRVALRRAAHQLLDHPRVLGDPLAVPMVGDAIDELRTNPARHQSGIARRVRSFMVARGRYAEDELAASVLRGVRQYLILGAGLDTSAHRGVAAPGNLRVIRSPERSQRPSPLNANTVNSPR